MANKHKPKHAVVTPFPWNDLFFLLLKLAILGLLLAVMFWGVFGVCRCGDSAMSPACKDSDLVFYYRLQKSYQASDTVVLKKDGEKQIRRIIAVEGDTIELTEDGLKINGYLQQEPEIHSETLPYTDGVTFPLTVGKGEYFVLGDNRPHAKDSRFYGTVRQKEIKGLVITLLRRRGF